ncbi:AbrB/MazE/SpoVT family DNA-binding domain-containing protein [Halorussus aquaticus]|uniref:AbrB/MazE/SpoVT family DNA-binding domain-containing protein n=1 Tax=Halorussus aquaticus TaxID=2953748 RepID=A0ABD5Q379_9EURY|nr:AbrB/MazE/SpoVT family DNA-binding domain-containing protein [Halorussus aquaticus]
MPKTTVQVTESTVETSDGDTRETKQYRVTIPKQMAEFFSLEQGDELEWSSGSASNKMEVTVHKND